MVGLGFRVDEGSKILKDTKWVNFNVNQLKGFNFADYLGKLKCTRAAGIWS